MPPGLSLSKYFQNLTVLSHSLPSSHLITLSRRGFGNDANPTDMTSQPDASSPPPPPPNRIMPPFIILKTLKTATEKVLNGSEATNEKNAQALRKLKMVSYGLNPFDVAEEGHKYGLPDLPLPSTSHMKHRYDPIIEQLTRLLMWDGKLSKAQREVALVLNFLRRSPPPKINPQRPLIPGSPPPTHLPLDPVTYLKVAIDSVAPLVRIRHYRGAAGGGHSLEVPFPLEVRQRRRLAVKWILEVVEKKKANKGSGRTMLASRVAEEIVAIVEGKSQLWEKRLAVHKLGTATRSNLQHRVVTGKR